MVVSHMTVSTPEIKDEHGKVLEHSIAKLERVELNSRNEWISIRGEKFLAYKSPDSYHAVIGTGQMVDFLETENLDYDKALEIAENKGDTDKIKKLKENGRPPYYGSDVTWKSAEYLNYLSSYMSSNPDIQNGGYNTFRDLFSPEYSILDKINYLRGIVTTFHHVYPQFIWFEHSGHSPWINESGKFVKELIAVTRQSSQTD